MALFFRSILDFGFPAYEKIAGVRNKKWHRAMRAIPVKDIVKSLDVRGKHYVLGHGDFKPNNWSLPKKETCGLSTGSRWRGRNRGMTLRASSYISPQRQKTIPSVSPFIGAGTGVLACSHARTRRASFQRRYGVSGIAESEVKRLPDQEQRWHAPHR